MWSVNKFYESRHSHIFRLYSSKALEFMGTVMNMDGKYVVRLRLYLVFPLHNGFSPAPLFITIEYEPTCCSNAAGTTIRVVRHASSSSGIFMAIVAIICTVFPENIVDYYVYMLRNNIPRPISPLQKTHETSEKCFVD